MLLLLRNVEKQTNVAAARNVPANNREIRLPRESSLIDWWCKADIASTIRLWPDSDLVSRSQDATLTGAGEWSSI